MEALAEKAAQAGSGARQPGVKKCFEEHLEEFVTMFVRFNCLEVKADGDLGWAWQDVNQTFDGFQVHLLPVVPSWWKHAMVKLCPAAKDDVRVSYVVQRARPV